MADRLPREGSRAARETTRPRRRRTGAPDSGWPVGPVATSTGTAEIVVAPDDRDRVTLFVNGVPSSHLDLADPGWLEFEYMQEMAAVVDTIRPGPLRALHLGAAGCTFPRWLEHARPHSRQLAVDIDEVLVRLVREWFDLPRSPALRLRVGDAGAVVATQRPGAWDVVVRDVFAGDETPRALTTATFTADVRRTLAPGGVYLANCADRPPLASARAEAATLATAFTRTALLAEPGVLKGRRYGNVVLVGTDAAGPDLADPALERRLRSLPVPVRLLTGSPLTQFVAGARPVADPSHGPEDDEAAPSAEDAAPHA